MKSRNIVFPEPNKVEVREEELAPLKSKELLVQAKTSLISAGTEMRCLRGHFDPDTNWATWVKYPFKPGYGMAGEVVEVGSGVRGFAIGDLVSVSLPHSEYFTVSSGFHRLLKLPKGITLEEATWMSLAMTTQLGVRRGELKLGERVGVVGLGPLGQLVVQYLSLIGVRQLVAIDPVESRLSLAKSSGATHTLCSGAGEAADFVKDITGGKMLDVVFDVTGHPAVLAASLPLARELGRVILVGDTTTPSQQNLGAGIVSGSKSIHGIHSSAYPKTYSPFNTWTFEEMSSLFFDYLLQEKMNVQHLRSHSFAIDDAPKAYELLRDQPTESMGVIFDYSI
jgi:2-desacetyl-2-hydroxyethyl bacteriochlorophyllide A dehydrogenase